MLRILVVSHDVGGANVLSALVKKYQHQFDWVFCLVGPAEKIFSMKKINVYAKSVTLTNTDIDATLRSARPDFILTGTGWESDLEIGFIRSARKQGICVAAFLDHWDNYQRRFGTQGSWLKNLPDFILVGDRWAYKRALKNGFPKNILRPVENPYFAEIIKETTRIKKDQSAQKRAKKGNKLRIMYLSEPISDHFLKSHHNPYYWGYTEYEVIRDLLKIIKKFSAEIPLEFKIRLHPREKLGKYSQILNDKDFRLLKSSVIISDPRKKMLIDDCLMADVVIGSESMALVVALLMGKKVISYIPSKKKKCSLPQGGIKRTSTLLGLIQQIFGAKNKFNAKSEKNLLDLYSNSFLSVINGMMD